MTTARQTVAAAAGVAAIAVAVGVTVGVVPAAVLGPVTRVNATLATGALATGLVGYALHRRRRNPETGGPEPLADAETASAPDRPGEDVDAALRHVDADANAVFTRNTRERVRARVRDTAVRAYATRYGVSEPRAEDAIAAGDWTRDRIAAAFLAGEHGPRYPLRERLRGWIHPGRAYRRRVERAAREVHALAVEESP